MIMVLKTPPGGWGVTSQAVDRFFDEVTAFNVAGGKRYLMPNGPATADPEESFTAWIEFAEASADDIHPDRRK
jgi:hypothetical protein